jgi:hypothetical protein
VYVVVVGIGVMSRVPSSAYFSETARQTRSICTLAYPDSTNAFAEMARLFPWKYCQLVAHADVLRIEEDERPDSADGDMMRDTWEDGPGTSHTNEVRRAQADEARECELARCDESYRGLGPGSFMAWVVFPRQTGLAEADETDERSEARTQLRACTGLQVGVHTVIGFTRPWPHERRLGRSVELRHVDFAVQRGSQECKVGWCVARFV